MHPLVALLVFAVVGLAELPDKTMVATLVLGSRYRPSWVFSGAAAAFTVHVVIAVTAGGLLTLLPHRVVEAVSAALFLTGAALLLREIREDEPEAVTEQAEELDLPVVEPRWQRVVLTTFGVIFVGEWGDLTQILTANYAAKYDAPVAVGIGALLGLWAAAGVAVTVGQRLLRRVSPRLLHLVAAVVITGFGIASAVAAVRG